MKTPVWEQAIKASAAPERARHFLQLFLAADAGGTLAKATDEEAHIMAALFSGSQAMSNVLISHPEWLASLHPSGLKFPRRKQGLAKETGIWLKVRIQSQDFAAALRELRDFRQREMMRIAARDLARLGEVAEITREISDLADVCLDAVWQVCAAQFISRHGRPYHQDPEGGWHPTSGCVLGMGKLGGQELNYSSDVDVLFAYTEEGGTFREPPTRRKTPPVALSNHQFFNRLAEAFIAEVTRLTPEGSLYRIDLRLRPEGESGPLSRSLTSYENYYAQWGQTWERMMLIKARGVAGDDTLAAEFLETVQPFRYPRSINENVLGEVAAMKDRIENEVVKSDELDRNVKLGRGGIREVEFIVQSMQLLHAGKQPFLQGAQTLPGLEKLVQYELLSPGDARALGDAYCFLRNVEHRLQMDDNLQTHTIPRDKNAVERLARLMGFAKAAAFESARQAHAGNVRRVFEATLKADASAPTLPPFPRYFEGAEPEWRNILEQHAFRDPGKAYRVLREFVEGPGYVHVSSRTIGLAHDLLPKLLGLCPSSAPRPPGARILSDPDRVVTRLDSFISAYGARSTLFELWNRNPAIFELLLLLFDRSEFLAELAIRTPDLVDELVTSGRLRQRKSAEETLRDLSHGSKDEDQRLWLRRYHQAELMRIGLRDILGLADEEQYLVELSALADACLRYALGVVLRAHKLKKPPLVIIGLGKLGGAEIDYGSDLDIVFVAGRSAGGLTQLAQLAREVMDLLSVRTEQGMLFHTDARLRPDGEKGLLVNNLKAYEDYYRQRAQLWEIQSLTRTRPIAGDLALGERFQRLAATLTDFRKPSLPPAAYRPDWKARIHHMRMRIEKERTPKGKDDLAIKTGVGGLMDAEFIAQSLCLEHGWQEANTLRALQRARSEGALPLADELMLNYRKLRRVEGILRRWSYEGETVLPDDPAPFYRVAIRCGFATPEEFRHAVAQYRQAIRKAYQERFGAAAAAAAGD